MVDVKTLSNQLVFLEPSRGSESVRPYFLINGKERLVKSAVCLQFCVTRSNKFYRENDLILWFFPWNQTMLLVDSKESIFQFGEFTTNLWKNWWRFGAHQILDSGLPRHQIKCHRQNDSSLGRQAHQNVSQCYQLCYFWQIAIFQSIQSWYHWCIYFNELTYLLNLN